MNLQATFRISDRNISDGIRNVIRNTGLAGRWQIINHEPLTICDTAHNKEGLEFVIEQISKIPKSVLHIVIGFVNDKDLESVLPLFPAGAKYYFTRASVPRSLNEKTLKTEAARFGLMRGKLSGCKRLHWKVPGKWQEKSDLIFIGGSTFVVAEVI